MALILLASELDVNNQTNTALVLGSLLWISNPLVFVPPVLVTDIRTALDLGQPIPLTDAAFRAYIQRLYDVLVQDGSLSPGEISIYNEFRQFLEPPPRLACCDTPGIAPAAGNTTVKTNPFIGTVTQEREIQIQFLATVTCDAVKVVITAITPTNGGPAQTVGLPVNALPRGCSTEGLNIFSFLYADWGADPLVFLYDFDLDVRDKDDLSLGIYTKNISI